MAETKEKALELFMDNWNFGEPTIRVFEKQLTQKQRLNVLLNNHKLSNNRFQHWRNVSRNSTDSTDFNDTFATY